MQKTPRAVRRRRNIEAWVSAEGLAPHKCAVFNVSDTGMQLHSSLADKMPNVFKVEFGPTSPNNGTCRVMWRKNRSLGVKYER